MKLLIINKHTYNLNIFFNVFKMFIIYLKLYIFKPIFLIINQEKHKFNLKIF